METKKFKTFDKVIVKSQTDDYWTCDLYSHLNEGTGTHETISRIDLNDNDILPYEGNENLVGTTDEPDEEVRLQEGVALMVTDDSTFALRTFVPRHFEGIDCECFKCDNNIFWEYAIRFSDFNPNDMEETLKHILYVKNGRIVRYREQ